jgi:hypothetical protein
LQIITALGENKLVFILGGLILYGIVASLSNCFSSRPLVKAMAEHGGGTASQSTGVAFKDSTLKTVHTMTYTAQEMIPRAEAEAAVSLALLATLQKVEE